MGVIILLLLSLAIQSIATQSTRNTNNEDWNAFKLEYNKHYSSPLEERYRMSVFLEAQRKVIQHNLNPATSFKVKTNEFADLRPDEFNAMKKGYKMGGNGNQTTDPRTILSDHKNSRQAPQTVDWRRHGVVTRVKDQGRCGSCWAFAATGALEAQTAFNTGNLVAISEQNLVDCDRRSSACEGGWMQYAFQYIRENQGINTESSYRYEGQQRQCRYRTNNVGATCRGYGSIRSGDEGALKDAVWNIGPISVAIDSSDERLQYYDSGVYYGDRCSERNLDHAVLVVGYGNEDGRDYWLVKNSWGERWGDRGYIKMARNRNNNCGIATDASYPVV